MYHCKRVKRKKKFKKKEFLDIDNSIINKGKTVRGNDNI